MSFTTKNNKEIKDKSILSDFVFSIDAEFEHEFQWKDVFAQYDQPARYHIAALLPLLEQFTLHKDGHDYDIHQVVQKLNIEFSAPKPKAAPKPRAPKPKTPGSDHIQALEKRIQLLEQALAQMNITV